MRHALTIAALAVVAALALAGLPDSGLTTRSYAVTAELADAAGLAPNSEVAYRGVRVGRVAALHPVPDGVRAELALDSGTQVPAETAAIVTTRAAVGGRYLDLRPDGDRGPYLRDGATIPRSRTSGPVPLETLLLNLGALAGSVNQDDLTMVVDELARALDGTGPVLAAGLDAQRALLTDAEQTLPQTIALLKEGRTALARQAAAAGALRSWAGALAAVSSELTAKPTTAKPGASPATAHPNAKPATAEPALGFLDTATAAMQQLTDLLRGLAPAQEFLLSNLVVTGQVQNRRLDGLQQILITYPSVVAHGMRVVPGDGTAHLGLVLDAHGPPPCPYSRRSCSPPRGADRTPRPAGPEPPGDPHPAPAADPGGLPLFLGGTGGQAAVLGGASWKALLLGPLAA